MRARPAIARRAARSRVYEIVRGRREWRVTVCVCVCVCVGGGLAVEGWRVMGMGGQAGTGGGGMAGDVAVPVGRWRAGGRADGRSRAG